MRASPSPLAAARPSTSTTIRRAPFQVARTRSGSERHSSRRSSARPAKRLRRLRSVPGSRASDRTRAAATAGGLRVRIADHELRAVQALAVVDLGAEQVLQAQRVDQQGDAVALHRDVVLGLVLIELEAVLEARTATAGDVDAQLEVGIAFLADQLADLRGRGRGEVQRLLEL